MVLYGPWENTAYPMFMHWSVSLGWLWNCNVVNQKAPFLCTLYIHIYLFIYSDSLLFGKMYDKETFFSWSPLHYCRPHPGDKNDRSLNVFCLIFFFLFMTMVCLLWEIHTHGPQKSWNKQMEFYIIGPNTTGIR